MNHLRIAVAVVAGCLIVGYPAASWYSGTRIESRMNALSQQADQYPNLKVVKHEFTRGVFSSTEETIVEFPAGLLPKLPPAPNGDAPHPFQLHLINHIQHGPFPGLRFGVASIDTELVLDGETKTAAEKIFGKQAPLQIRTNLNYWGGGSVLLSSPAFTATDDQTKDKIDWKGVNATVGFSGDYKNLRMQLDAPGLNAHLQDGSDVTMTAIAVTADLQQAAPNSFFYLGKTSATLDQLKADNSVTPAKSFDLEKLAIASDVSAKDDLVDMTAKVSAQKLVANTMEFSDFHYDYGIRHLHEPTLIKLFDAFNHPAKYQNGADPAQAALGPWKEFGPLLLQNNPEFSLDRISVTTPDGEAKVSAKATLDDIAAADLQNMVQLLPKLRASATVSLPEPMLTKLIMSSNKDPSKEAAMQEGVKQQIAMFEQQGYIIRHEQALSANFDWKQGQATINGKPFGR